MSALYPTRAEKIALGWTQDDEGQWSPPAQSNADYWKMMLQPENISGLGQNLTGLSFSDWQARGGVARGSNTLESQYASDNYSMPKSGGDFWENYGWMLPAVAMTAGAAGAGFGAAGAPAAEGVAAGGLGAGASAVGGESGGLLSGADLAGDAAGLYSGNGAFAGGALDATGAGTLASYAPVADLSPASSGGLPAASAGGVTSLVPSGGTTGGIPNNLLLGGLQAGLGYLGSTKQADAYSDVANQNAAYGAPYRALLQQSYQPGFDLWSQPGYADAANRAADISTRQWAARAGNPAGNPTAQAGIYRDVLNETFLPALANYRGGLMQGAGMGLNTSGQASMASAGQEGGMYNALGYGLNTALNPQPSYEDVLKKYGLTVGGVKA